MTDRVRTVGALRGITAQAKSVDPVEVYVYLPGTREPVRGYIAGHMLRNPTGDPKSTERVLTIQVLAEHEPEPAADPAHVGETEGGAS